MPRCGRIVPEDAFCKRNLGNLQGWQDGAHLAWSPTLQVPSQDRTGVGSGKLRNELTRLEFDDAAVLAGVREADFGAVLRQEVRKALAPFDEHERGLVEEVFQAEVADFFGGIEAVEIDVIDADRIAIFMDEGEGRARNILGAGGAAGFDDALGECGLSGAELADQQDDAALGKQAGEFNAEAAGLFV